MFECILRNDLFPWHVVTLGLFISIIAVIVYYKEKEDGEQ